MAAKYFFPTAPTHSEIVPIGHSQEQNDFFSNRLVRINAISNSIDARWIGGKLPVSHVNLTFINPAIGSQPSMPPGLDI